MITELLIIQFLNSRMFQPKVSKVVYVDVSTLLCLKAPRSKKGRDKMKNCLLWHSLNYIVLLLGISLCPVESAGW